VAISPRFQLPQRSKSNCGDAGRGAHSHGRRTSGEFPRIGHAGRVPSTFEWVVRGLPYIVVYDINLGDEDEIVILGVFHGAQDRESGQ
jgi:plasmid stabilization system protein ParE